MTRLVVEFDWTLTGNVKLDTARAVGMPSIAGAPGVYRFWIETGLGRPYVYVGETINLRQRMRQYAKPGADQSTNLRMNAELKRLIGAGARVSLWIVTKASVQLDGDEPTELDLERKTSRLIVENAAVAAIRAEDLADDSDHTERAVLLNLPGVGEAVWEPPPKQPLDPV